MKLIYQKPFKGHPVGSLVNVGDKVITSDGTPVEVLSFNKPHKSSSSGKVFLQDIGTENKYEVYVGVIDAEWVEREDRETFDSTANEQRTAVLLAELANWNEGDAETYSKTGEVSIDTKAVFIARRRVINELKQLASWRKGHATQKIQPPAPTQTLSISAKCSDMFNAVLQDESVTPNVRQEYDGYVPDWFPNTKEQHFGDYVQLEIDVDTGRILNWKKPTQAQLKESFK